MISLQIVLTIDEMYEKCSYQLACHAGKKSQESPRDLQRTSGLQVSRKGDLPACSCRSNDLCRRLSKWLICPSVWSLGRSIFHQYSFITQCSLKPAWCDGRNMRWQMMSSDAPHNWESQEIKSAGVWGCGVLRGHKLRFLWAKITELEQTGTSDQHNIRSHTDNKFKNLKFTHPCQGSLISCAR